MAIGIFIPAREITEAIQRHCDRIQEALDMSFDIGDPVQARHGRAVWEAQVAVARDRLEARMEQALGDAVGDIIAELDDGEFFAQAAIAIDEEETIPGVQQLSELCNPQR